MRTVLHITHIIQDDKFWRIPIYWFEQLMNCSCRYVCVVDDVNKSFDFIVGDLSDRVEKITYVDAKRNFKEGISDVYMFHPLTIYYYDLVLSLPKNKIVIWSSWGYDIYYGDGLFPSICKIELYKHLTQKDLDTHFRNGFWDRVKHKIKYLIQYFDNNGEHNRELAAKRLSDKVVSRISYFSSVLDSEYDLMKQHRCFRANYFPFKYTYGRNLEQVVMNPPDGNTILLGNSADPSNNFADVLDVLNKRGIKNKLFVPLAYGEDWYKEITIKHIETLGFPAIIQKEFVPYDEYISLIRQCRVAVFGHIRQQAMGNMTSSLFNGCKVFLYKDSIAYHFLKSKGFYVFSIDDDLSNVNIEEILTEEQRRHNMNLLLEMENPDKILRNLQAAVNDIVNKL